MSSDFENFDDSAIFGKFEDAVCSPDSLNFVLEFNVQRAICALDLNAQRIGELIAVKGTDHPLTRWINIWAPEKQKDVLGKIGVYYDFSPRLLALMCCDPLPPVIKELDQHPSKYQEFFNAFQNQKERKAKAKTVDLDLEGYPEPVGTLPLRPGKLDLNHYRIVNEVWHYSSVDWGRDYLCIGYNSLYNTTASTSNETTQAHKWSNYPAGKRVWSWLILCADGTVISINENPYPNRNGGLTNEEQIDLSLVRRNLINVVRELRTSDESRSEAAIMALPIRKGLQPAPGKDAPNLMPADASSLLFYYLFDDWYTSYSLVARREHQYGARLERLRREMFVRASLAHMDELHHIGRQLAVLKRIYQSYDMIIGRILEGPKPTKNSKHQYADSKAGFNALVHETQKQNASETEKSEAAAYGAPVATAASVRFERLKGRISLYALTEIQDCLDEKEALVMLNVNLITMKQSTAVERLTRITILLAKATIPFLGLSLMTAYFSVPAVADLYTPTTYWVTFSIIAVISLIFLVVFGQLSGTQEGRTIYRSLTKAGLEVIGRKPSYERDNKKE